MHADFSNVINQKKKFMNIVKKHLFLSFSLIILLSCNSTPDNKSVHVLINTSEGNITVKLYDGTPVHRDNFLKLVSSGFYDGVIFHRVIDDFMIQTGDLSTRTGLSDELRDTLSRHTLPAEFRPEYFHKKGALAAARQGNDINPGMRSSGTQFYIVQGKKYSDIELSSVEKRINTNIKQNMFNKLIKEVTDSISFTDTLLSEGKIQEIASKKMFYYLTTIGDFKFSDHQINIYKTIGGTPFLDGTYTVFGEVTDGFNIIDKISVTSTDSNDKPLNDIKIIRMKIITN